MSPGQRRPDGLGDFLKARRDGSGQRLMVLTAEAGTPPYERLCILASWNAELICDVPALPVPGEAL